MKRRVLQLAGSAAAPAVAAALALLALVALSGHPHVTRAEDAAITRGRAAAAFWAALPASPRAALRTLGETAGTSPGLGDALTGAAIAVAEDAFGELRAARAATALAGALVTLLLVALGRAVAGRAGGLLAPALFWLAPRHLAAGLSAGPDLAAAALALATAWAYRSAAAERGRASRLRLSAVAGVAFGLAVAVRLDLLALLPALAAHAAGAAVLARVYRTDPDGAPEGIEARLHGVPAPLAAMIAIGLPLGLAGSPWAWSAPVTRTLGALLAGPTPALGPFAGPAAPAALVAFTVPGAVLVLLVGGALVAVARAARAMAGRGGHPAVASDDALLLACAAAPLAAAALGVARGPGLAPVLPALPFLALLAARGLDVASHAAWPSRPRLAIAIVAAAALLPAALATARARPAGAAGWNELVRGPAGAASLGLPRQDGGEGAAGVLEALSARARPGARVLWVNVAPAAVRAWTRSGLLRADLLPAPTAAEADLAVVALDGGSRDAEHRARAALRTDRPVAGAYVDEVPLAFVYSRAGAWR